MYCKKRQKEQMKKQTLVHRVQLLLLLLLPLLSLFLYPSVDTLKKNSNFYDFAFCTFCMMECLVSESK
jgi:hypothetical protein